MVLWAHHSSLELKNVKSNLRSQKSPSGLISPWFSVCIGSSQQLLLFQPLIKENISQDFLWRTEFGETIKLFVSNGLARAGNKKIFERFWLVSQFVQMPQGSPQQWKKKATFAPVAEPAEGQCILPISHKWKDPQDTVCYKSKQC